MGLFDFFRSRKQISDNADKDQLQAFYEIFDKLKTEIKTMHMLLQKHDQSIDIHGKVIEKHRRKLEKLVDQPGSGHPKIKEQKQCTDFRHTQVEKPPTGGASPEKSDKLNLESLSRQERKILNVFFQHPDMALSYVDIGSFLKKSPNTIKNQMRQLRMKADLFSKSCDDENRNRFRIRDRLRLEKYLKLEDSSSD